jgi:FdhD protein
MSSNELQQSGPAVTSIELECLKLTGGLFSRKKVGVVVEKPFSININGRHLATASITPGMEKEFVTGYLFGQGFIESVQELKSVIINDYDAEVTVKSGSGVSRMPEETGYHIVSGGGRVAYYSKTEYPEIQAGLKIKKDIIFRAMNTVFAESGIYQDTEGVHSAGLFDAEGNILCIVEDIGRHNTLDKLIGYALMNNIDCGGAFLASTGRMASEMVGKICRAGIPVVATKTAVTDKGIEIGRRYGMTVIGFVRDAGTRINTDMETRIIAEPGMKIYTHAERILCN